VLLSPESASRSRKALEALFSIPLLLLVYDDKLHIYVCPKPYQEEIGVNFSKGDQVAVEGNCQG